MIIEHEVRGKEWEKERKSIRHTQERERGGRKEREGRTRAYLIYGIYRQTGQDRPEKKLHGKYGRLLFVGCQF